MLQFLKHHWSKREKFIARWSFTHLIFALVCGIIVAALLLMTQSEKVIMRVNNLRDMAEQVQQVSKLPPGSESVGGHFNLINQDGQPMSDVDFLGRYMLIYFGYTYCPDMCPSGLQGIAKVIDLLGADSAKLAPIFITIDPQRDTPEKVKAYVAQFHPNIIGLTGNDLQVADVAAKYQVYYAKGEQVDDHDYLMDHSSLIYLMGPDGSFITTFPEDVDPATIVHAIRSH